MAAILPHRASGTLRIPGPYTVFTLAATVLTAGYYIGVIRRPTDTVTITLVCSGSSRTPGWFFTQLALAALVPHTTSIQTVGLLLLVREELHSGITFF